ncbi:hypothetical protein SEPCBS57363_003026 [Sporothrix epigloea]|uniref:RanBD1 domain-containing protein n=1 Tax=Sporothrix epigloea TaxID=1892477 RepID=A0ABP0DJ64_9PEZI
METPQKRQKSWFSSLTGLVSASRSSNKETAALNDDKTTANNSSRQGNSEPAASRTRLTRPMARPEVQTPVRHSGTFSAPPVESPESPAKRASSTQLAQRKIHDRAQGPSSRIGSTGNVPAIPSSFSYGSSLNLYSNSSLGRPISTPRRTNFSSATTPRNMFRDSIARDMPNFTFTPRVPSNTLRGSFPATTPGRSLRAPGAELSARDMAKVTSSDLFHQKIPDPDPTLNAEAMTEMIPSDLRSSGLSVYANEFLAHLCPPDFNEEQRNQFFCILDLRRLKFAADDVFVKKDWKLNITNFAKEYEKNRSLILLRYGLYEFKTIKVCKDAFQKWRHDHNIPNVPGEDTEELMVNPADLSKSTRASSVPKLNGTEGILRTGKRKATDTIDPQAMEADNNEPAFQATKKRTRPDGSKVAAERVPFNETSTPSLNKSKRKASRGESADQLQRAKQQKPTSAAPPSMTPSATKALFERVANSPAKKPDLPPSITTPSIEVTKPVSESTESTENTEKSKTTSSPEKSLLFKPSSLGDTLKPSANGSLVSSVLEGGLKGSAASKGGNIFGYLSDASSAKGSGTGTADADAEDTDSSDKDDTESQEEASSKKVLTGASALAAQTPASFFGAKSVNPLFGGINTQTTSASSPEVSDATPGRSIFDRVNKGTDGQPLRAFGSASSSQAFPSASVASETPLFSSKPTSERASPEKDVPPAPVASSLFGVNNTWTPDSPIKFAPSALSAPSGSVTPAKPLFGSTPVAAQPATSGTTPASSPFKFGNSTSTGAPVTTSSTESLAAEKTNTVPTLTENAKEVTPTPVETPSNSFGFPTKPAPSSTTLFGKPAEKLAESAPTSAFAPASASTPNLFGSSNSAPSAPAPFDLFGKPAAPKSAAAPSLFGAAASSAPTMQSQNLFGNVSKSDTPLFGLKRSADADEDAASKTNTPAFGSSKGTSLCGSAAVKANESNGSGEPQAKKSFFGASSDSASNSAASAPLFQLGGSATNGIAAKPATSSLFGAATQPPTTNAPSLFGNSMTTAAPVSAAPAFSFGTNNTNATQPTSGGGLFSFGAKSTQLQTQPQQSPMLAPSTGFSFGGASDAGSTGSSFMFNAGGAGGSSAFNNPFASAGGSAAGQPSTFSFGAGSANGQAMAPSSSMFQFGGSSTPTANPSSGAGGLFSSGGASQATEAVTTPGNSFGNMPAAGGSSGIFSFGAGGATAGGNSLPQFGQQQSVAPGGSVFNLAPPLGGTSTGTNSPFTNRGGTPSLATTPATSTPEPGATQDNNADNSGHQADGDEAPQEQISLTDGGPGEEDEAVVHEVRAKALRLATSSDESGSESPVPKDKKSPWKTEGVGALRLLKNKTTGIVRLLLRAEPRGHVALNRALLPDFTYKPEPNAKYVKLTTANGAGTGLETWMLQVKTKEAAQQLADALEMHKVANKK